MTDKTEVSLEEIDLDDLLSNNFKDYCSLRDQAYSEGYVGYPHFHMHKLFEEWKQALLDKQKGELKKKLNEIIEDSFDFEEIYEKFISI